MEIYSGNEKYFKNLIGLIGVDFDLICVDFDLIEFFRTVSNLKNEEKKMVLSIFFLRSFGGWMRCVMDMEDMAKT